MRVRSLTHLLLAVAVAGFVAVAPMPTASAAAPQLSIAVDDGQDSTVPGDKLSYTVTVTNLGTKRVKDLVVSQTVPATSKFGSADSGGVERKGKVTWKVDIAATERATMQTTMTVLQSPDDTLRLATVACAAVTKKDPPAVCASDSNELPAGAAAVAQEDQPDGSWTSVPHLLWYVAGGGVVLLGLVVTALALRPSRRRPPSYLAEPAAAESAVRRPSSDGGL